MTTTEPKAGLVTLGLTPQQRPLLDGLHPVHVVVDPTDSIGVSTYVLHAVDAAGELATDVAVLLVGPYAFGWACSGQLTDLRGWSQAMGDQVILLVCPDQQDRETIGMASEVYTRLGANAGVFLNAEPAMAQLRELVLTGKVPGHG